MAFGTLTHPTEILKVIDSNISSKSRHPASKRGLYSSGYGIIGVPIIMNPLRPSSFARFLKWNGEFAVNKMANIPFYYRHRRSFNLVHLVFAVFAILISELPRRFFDVTSDYITGQICLGIT